MARIADSSVLYALYDEEDEHHERARRALGHPEPVMVPSEILVETVDLLAYRWGWDRGLAALDALMETPHVSRADPVHLEAVHRLHRAADGALSLADAFVVQTCRALGAEPLAFDDAIHRAVG